MPDTKLSPEGFRTAATALRERPVEDPHSYTEPAQADPADPNCRVCFVAALSAGFLASDSVDAFSEGWYAALDTVEAEIEPLLAFPGHSMTQALEVYGPEFCAQICEDIANEMENPHA